ncbi:hypothetical protein LOTGIDRAFT_230881 [Lottia gigantea]|uniref:Uncharacterized protein n=1 Tax=Lottia gigantea TaxID=225164 RepID=V4AY34_LOTGI|nr:hypothetical protein LOTGIDRAFT_230881 [Lottia gigantea]ESO99955.1 hypothetical protein LOTGIDRAFT_230881 [Lottia gigantea]
MNRSMIRVVVLLVVCGMPYLAETAPHKTTTPEYSLKNFSSRLEEANIQFLALHQHIAEMDKLLKDFIRHLKPTTSQSPVESIPAYPTEDDRNIVKCRKYFENQQRIFGIQTKISMTRFGIILILVTLATCFQPTLSLVERLKSLERLSQVSSDFFLNKVKVGGLRERMDRDAQMRLQQANGTTNRTLITSRAFEILPQPGNDLISKQSSNPFINTDLASMFSRPKNGEKIPPPPRRKTTYMRPEISKDILSIFNRPAPRKSDNEESMNSGFGMPRPVVEKKIEQTSVASKIAKPATLAGPLSIYNLPIVSRPVDQIPAYDNEVETKQNMQSQTTVNVKSTDPAPPTTAKVVSIENLISKQDELFGLILQYHTEVNKLIKDILAKLDAKGP